MNSDFTLAVHSLTLLSLLPERMSSSDAIAESASVHPVRIRKILSILRKHGFIQSKEGTGGGFIFTSNPNEINLWDIYKITSAGALQPKCPEVNTDCIVGANMKSVLFSVFSDAEEHLGDFLCRYNIEDVMNLVKQKQEQAL
ncbi:RrF2 family transcriptional regulator [Terrihalobacillus insolitus]|uniref:RrF2 family transcriptional regulator n=1 Tax=Terrihalobacillus insolitus TaxID=2950438 RepID=UPI0023406A5B|nr:Rrf2 family transcriptional regulator [Terrihalobacillus insolitus]MDC3414013.1 Rrf2 family transcriptional regulator [Terrihalobacillus insolitus]